MLASGDDNVLARHTPPARVLLLVRKPVRRQSLALKPIVTIARSELPVIVEPPGVHGVVLGDAKCVVRPGKHVAEFRLGDAARLLESHHVRLEEESDALSAAAATEALGHTTELPLLRTAERDDVTLLAQDGDVVAARRDLDGTVEGAGVDELGERGGAVLDEAKGTVGVLWGREERDVIASEATPINFQ